MTRVWFQHLQADVDDANANEASMRLLIASCPSRNGDDETVMHWQQVTEMVGAALGTEHALFSLVNKVTCAASTLGY